MKDRDVADGAGAPAHSEESSRRNDVRAQIDTSSP